MDMQQNYIDMTNDFDDEDDLFLILNEADKQYAIENNLKIAYSDIDLEDGSYQEQVPARKNRLCPNGAHCAFRECNLLHSLHQLILFPCKDQHLCPNVIYHRDGYFLNVRDGCFNVHGNEKRKDFFIRNRLVIDRPAYVHPVKIDNNRECSEEKGIMFRPRRIVQKPDEQLIKTLVCQSIKKNFKCKFGEQCTFAHKYRDLKITYCKARLCSKLKGDEPCPYIHMDETAIQFALRNNFHRYFPDEVQPPLPSF